MHPKLIQAGVHKRASEPKYLQEIGQTQCAHCTSKSTPLWRKAEGRTVCNACGIYWRTHGRYRPVENVLRYPRVVRIRQVYSLQELLGFSKSCVIQGHLNKCA